MESKLLKKVFFAIVLITIAFSLLVIAFADYLREWAGIISWIFFTPVAIIMIIAFIFEIKYRLREVEKKRMESSSHKSQLTS